MFSPFLLSLGLAVFGLACRTFHHLLIQKLGLLAFMAASFVFVEAISGSIILGALAVLVWFCLPWIELLTRVRRMDLPMDRPLRRRVLPNADFPFLGNATDEIEELSEFERVDDWGYEWQGTQHFFRLFYDPATKIQAAVCMTRDEALHHAYVKLVSRSKDGRVFTTWNHPFPPSLKLNPEQRLHWDRTSESFDDILASHLDFLAREGVSEEAITGQKPEEMLDGLRKDQRRLVDHNLALGVLRASGEGVCRYTWRGLIFLWAQFVKEMVRLH